MSAAYSSTYAEAREKFLALASSRGAPVISRVHPTARGAQDEELAIDKIGRATSELQSLMRISYAVFCLKKKKKNRTRQTSIQKEHKNKQVHNKEKNTR